MNLVELTDAAKKEADDGVLVADDGEDLALHHRRHFCFYKTKVFFFTIKSASKSVFAMIFA